jgi:hypothetical protein
MSDFSAKMLLGLPTSVRVTNNKNYLLSSVIVPLVSQHYRLLIAY